MKEPQPREQRQPAQAQAQSQHQQNRARTRITADAQTPRRPRAIAGQRAAAKRAGMPVQGDRPARTGVLVEPVEAVEAAEVDTSGESMRSVEPAKGAKAAGTKDTAGTTASATSSLKPAKRTRRTRRTLRTRRPQRPGMRRAVVTAVLALAVVAALAVTSVLAVRYRDATRTDHARTAAMAAAEKAAPVIFSYDYRHLDQDFAKAEAYLTGSFRDQYAKTTQTVVKPTALQYNGVVRAVVAKPAAGGAPAVSVVSASPDRVVILAFIDQSTTSTRVAGTQVDQNRVLLTLTDTAQGWLISAVDAL